MPCFMRFLTIKYSSFLSVIKYIYTFYVFKLINKQNKWEVQTTIVSLLKDDKQRTPCLHYTYAYLNPTDRSYKTGIKVRLG